MNNFYYFHFCLKPIDLEISNFNFSVQSIFSVVAGQPYLPLLHKQFCFYLSNEKK